MSSLSKTGIFTKDRYLEILPVLRTNTFAAVYAENDITMLYAAHIAVVMQNATAAVKEHADIITRHSNNEDWLLEIINQCFL